ncbi:hypothetical protein BRD56_11810 [Thermoplasmatales archaeon SW_10_69_26]|nr:MAG: hypothetical protein BRD56_11810 [Thermoplasmatales archaeon SW_10_69_26]
MVGGLDAVRSADDQHLVRLAENLDPLANPTRLRLLALLRDPQTLTEIELRKPEAERQKPLARQTVKSHLVKLMDAGAVVSRQAQREYGETTEYMLNNQRVFAMAEELRDLARLTPAEDPSQGTVQGDPVLGEIEAEGPHLVLVKGVPEGRVFALDPAERDRWVLGRNRGLSVSLPSDPFVSAENALVETGPDGHRIRDLPDSRNGTIVNGCQLSADEEHELEPGDVIQAGKSTLIFRS